MARNKKQKTYDVTMKIEVEIMVTVNAESIQEAVDFTKNLRQDQLVSPADSDVQITDIDNVGVISICGEGFTSMTS